MFLILSLSDINPAFGWVILLSSGIFGMACVSLHTLFLVISFPAALLGLVLVVQTAVAENANPTPTQQTSEHLLRMIFVYWAVYCLATFAQRLLLPGYPELAIPLKLTAVFTYLLTFASLLCLPLHFIEAKRFFSKGQS